MQVQPWHMPWLIPWQQVQSSEAVSYRVPTGLLLFMPLMTTCQNTGYWSAH